MDNSDVAKKKQRTGKIQILVPKKSSLKHRLLIWLNYESYDIID